MFPGMGGMNPKKMQAMMKQLGIKQEEVDSNRVVIEREEGNIVIDNPSVMKVEMQGQETWQITGEVSEEENSGVREEDVKLVAEKSGRSEEESRKALEESDGQVADAIVKLSE